MEKPIKPGRVAALACLLALLVIVFVVALYKLQIVDGKAYYEENRNSVASSQTVAAARGSILDRYGLPLLRLSTTGTDEEAKIHTQLTELLQR